MQGKLLFCGLFTFWRVINLGQGLSYRQSIGQQTKFWLAAKTAHFISLKSRRLLERSCKLRDCWSSVSENYEVSLTSARKIWNPYQPQTSTSRKKLHRFLYLFFCPEKEKKNIHSTLDMVKFHKNKPVSLLTRYARPVVAPKPEVGQGRTCAQSIPLVKIRRLRPRATFSDLGFGR